MQKRLVTGLLFILAGVLLFGCAPIPYVQTGWDYWPPDKAYEVYGRVVNFKHQPVVGAKVVLVRRAYWASDEERSQPGYKGGDRPVKAEYLVATSERSGDYSFTFEPWGAYDVWLYFDASGQGFEPQYVQLNPHMRSQIMRGPGRNPINVNIVMEPIQDKEKRELLKYFGGEIPSAE
jgi:hypothetical protein